MGHDSDGKGHKSSGKGEGRQKGKGLSPYSEFGAKSGQGGKNSIKGSCPKGKGKGTGLGKGTWSA